MSNTTQPAPPPDYYAPPPEKKKHTVRNILLILTLVFVLFVGGCFALVGAGLNAADKAIKEDANKAGGTSHPMSITVNKAFEVDGFDYQDGWSVRSDALGDLDIKGLKVTNNRDDKDSAIVEIKFWKGTEVLALSDCATDPIDPGTTVTVSCLSTDALPKKYDKITINDTF
jgi:hypothetical protein